MFSSRHPNHAFSFHNDEALQDQTPEILGILAGLPKGAAAIGHLLVHGSGSESKRAAIAKLPMNHPLSRYFMAKGVQHYWDSMLHPPLSYRGDAFQYRSADGADNNILHPQLGKAGMPYAKSVPGKTRIHGARPDPGDLFDLLLARKDDKESELGISSMLLYHATIIIHDIFRTNADDKNISDTSSYLDLSPLYGCDQANQATVRQHKLGLLKPDSFAERRLLLQPPGVCIYLIMYNRFHNLVAQQLLEINENGKFSLPFAEDSPQWNNLSDERREAMLDKQDEDLFQTARLITCGLYINISIHDYLRVLMKFHPKDTPWTLDPRIEIPGKDRTGVQRGVGNQVSAEFNLLYRFHSPISRRDRLWSEGFFKMYLRQYVGKGITEEQIESGDIPVPFFKEVIERGNGKGKSKKTKDEELEEYKQAKFLPAGLETMGFEVDEKGKLRLDAKKRPVPIYKFKRDVNGKFDDAQLVAEMVKVIEDPICQFGAQNVPKIFKAIEILGILQARKWEVATLNEFREFFGLERHKHFEDINADPGICEALRDLYENPDMVELYPGLFCEGNKRCLDPGTAGPNNGTTALWAGVFCDAVTLVRSDRFYTVDWNVASLTSWGMREVTSDPSILKGSVFHRLFQRAFPGYFKYNSIHLWQPFYTPAMNLIIADQQGYLSSLDLSDLQFKRDEDPTLLDPRISKLNIDFGDPKLSKNFQQFDYPQLSGRVRRKIATTGAVAEVARPNRVAKVSNYDDILNKVLGSNKAEFQNPGILDKEMIAGKYLQAMMAGTSKSFDAAARALNDLVTPQVQKLFLEYFVGVSADIIQREQRKFQKARVTVETGTESSRTYRANKAFFDEERRKLRILNLPQRVFEEELKNVNYLEGLAGKNPSQLNSDETAKLSVLAQTYQIDVVKDYAIPVVTRFVSDFLGFFDCIKTPAHTDRKYDENQIYQHIQSCQDYLAYDSDETTIWKRRMAFKNSVNFLKELSEYGATQTKGRLFGWFPRETQTGGDKGYVVAVRDFGVQVSKAMATRLENAEEVAAMMLVVALDVAHKSVMTFTEVLAHFIDHPHEEKPDVSNWVTIQGLAFEDSAEAVAKLQRYVLEAQRLRVDLPLVRIYSPTSATKTEKLWLTNEKKAQCTLKKGDRVLLQLRLAQECEEHFPNSSALDIDPKKRQLKDYLIYGRDDKSDFDTKQLTLIGLTGMLKCIATTKDLRVAHDKLGRLKRVKTPYGVESYMTAQWDQLVSFPTTWNLRFNGIGRGVYDGPDNANQGHGSDQVYQAPFLTPAGGSFPLGSGNGGLSTVPLPTALPSGRATYEG